MKFFNGPEVGAWGDPLKMDAGAPEPAIRTTPEGLLLVYRVGAQGLARLGRGEGNLWGRVLFRRVLAHRFGYPNDEILSAHPLKAASLEDYAFHVVAGSPWPAELETMNKAHPKHFDGIFKDYKHWIVTFKDETLEVLAELGVPLEPVVGGTGGEALRATL